MKTTCFLLSAFLLANTTLLNAQDPVKPECPTISVSATDPVDEGTAASFSAMISGKTGDITFNWSISNGTIESGQGTASILVTTTGLGDQSITATVEIGGLDRSCSSSSSATIMVMKMGPPSILVSKGQYTSMAAFRDTARAFAKKHIVMTIDDYTRGAVFIYPGKTTTDAQADALVKEIWALFEKEKVAPMMFDVLKGGKKEVLSYEMWSIPMNARDPEPSPKAIGY